MAKVLAVIPARWASTRLPGKSLVEICGKPLVVWVLESVKRARLVSDVIVATDDERIVRAVSAAGGKAVMTRADHPSGTDRVAEAACGLGADVVVNVQGDEPLVAPELIDRLAEALMSTPDWDMATAATPLGDPEEWDRTSVVKVVWDTGHRALYFSRAAIPHVRDAAMQSRVTYWRHIGIYAYRRAFLARLVATPPCLLEQAECLEQLRALHIGGRIGVVETEDRGIGVDTPADVERVERLMRELGLA
jgi:3-deoxy-manno-octulosonate cytidylyltransferase (CMP-KDO synthetase)